MPNNSETSGPAAPLVANVGLKPPDHDPAGNQAAPGTEVLPGASGVRNSPGSLAEMAPPKPRPEPRLDESGFWVVGDQTFRPARYVSPENGRAWGASFRGALRRGLPPPAACLEADLSWLDPPLTELDRRMPAWQARHGAWTARGLDYQDAADQADRDFALIRGGFLLLSDLEPKQTALPGSGLPGELPAVAPAPAFSSERPAIAESLPPAPVSSVAEAAAAGDPVVRSGLEGPKRRGRPPGSKTRPKAPARSGPGSVPAFEPLEADRRARARDVPTDGEGGPGIVGIALPDASEPWCFACGNPASHVIHAEGGAHGHRFERKVPQSSRAVASGDELPHGGPGIDRDDDELDDRPLVWPAPPPAELRPPAARRKPAPAEGGLEAEQARRALVRVGHEVAAALAPLPPWHRRHALTIAAAALRALDAERRIGNELDGRPLEAPHPPHPGTRHPLRLAEATLEARDRLRELLDAFDGMIAERAEVGE